MDYHEDPDPVCRSCTAWRNENEKLRAELAAARAEGYAACQADVVAFFELAHMVEDPDTVAKAVKIGWHVGAAKVKT